MSSSDLRRLWSETGRTSRRRYSADENHYVFAQLKQSFLLTYYWKCTIHNSIVLKVHVLLIVINLPIAILFHYINTVAYVIPFSLALGLPYCMRQITTRNTGVLACSTHLSSRVLTHRRSRFNLREFVETDLYSCRAGNVSKNSLLIPYCGMPYGGIFYSTLDHI